MPSEIRSEYKGVLITVSESDEAGYYRFWFQIGGHTFHGKTQTKLAGIAVKRAQRVIDRKLKEAYAWLISPGLHHQNKSG